MANIGRHARWSGPGGKGVGQQFAPNQGREIEDLIDQKGLGFFGDAVVSEDAVDAEGIYPEIKPARDGVREVGELVPKGLGRYFQFGERPNDFQELPITPPGRRHAAAEFSFQCLDAGFAEIAFQDGVGAFPSVVAQRPRLDQGEKLFELFPVFDGIRPGGLRQWHQSDLRDQGILGKDRRRGGDNGMEIFRALEIVGNEVARIVEGGEITPELRAA